MSGPLTTFYEGEDLVVYQNEFFADPAVPACIACFSAWSPSGRGTAFGAGYMRSRSLPALFFIQKRNHWWHTPEIELAAEKVRRLGRPVVLYGSSMGGYAALHLGEHFQARSAVALAPQVLIAPQRMPADPRWSQERSAVALRFDESHNLGACATPTYVFLDTVHPLERLHLNELTRCPRDGRRIFETPFLLHDAARVLVRSAPFKGFLDQVFSLGAVDGDRYAPLFSDTFKCDDKSYFNYFRNKSAGEASEGEKQEIVDRYRSSADRLDFEALYFAAEGLAKQGFFDLAVSASELSMARYPGSVIPPYLAKKHEDVLEMAHR